MDIDIPKYRKKRVKKTIKKSDHRHNYEPCLVYMWNSVMRAERCSICGKINNEHLFESEPCGPHLRRMLSEDELLEKYKDLKIYNKKTGKEIMDISTIKKEGH